MRLPYIYEVASLLTNEITRNLTDPSKPDLDVRLCVESDGSWWVNYGDVSYDTYHYRYCGAGTVSRGDSKATRRSVARDLLNQVRDQIAEEI